MTETYLGYRPGDGDTEWGSFFNPEMAPLPRHRDRSRTRSAGR